MKHHITLTHDNNLISSIIGEELPPGNRVAFVLFYYDDIAGAITFERMNSVLWSPHIFIHRQYRGNKSAIWGELALEYMELNLGAKKFLALTPYETGKRYAERVGFKCIGTLENSIKKDGQLLKQHMLERGTLYE